MASRIYQNIELLSKPTAESHIVNKAYVDNLLNARLQEGVKVVASEDLDCVYDLGTMTLTQNVGNALVIDGITLAEQDELIYIGANDKSQNGRYVVTTVGQGSVASSGTVSLGATNTGVITADGVTLTLATFETQVGTPTTGSYIFTYDGVTDNEWKLGGNSATLADYGIVIATEIPTDGDTITVAYTEAIVGTASVLTRSEKMNKSSQLFSGMLIPVHEGTVYGDSIFQLVSDGILELDSSALIFEKYKGANEGTEAFETTFVGNDTDTTFQITHGLNTKAVKVAIYDNATNEECQFGIKIISENAIEIVSDVVLTPTDEFRVVVLG